MEKILIDTDVIVDFLRGHQPRIKDVFLRIEKREVEALISIISVIELYSGKMNQKQADKLSLLLSFFNIISIENSQAKYYGRLIKEYHLSLADSLIAATSLILDIPLFTFNSKHFTSIPNLKIYQF